MSRSRGEGRSGAEKGQRVIEPKSVTRERRARAKAEEAEWAARSGPVEVRTAEPWTDEDMVGYDPATLDWGPR